MTIAKLLMQRCLDLAALGIGNVAPNPMVGAVLVHNDSQKILSEGHHPVFGGPHAERMAINRLMDFSVLGDCTLYINLEPCTHFGKTPPCVDLIIESKIPKVVIAAPDPNTMVSGKGIERLRVAGISVETGVLEKEARFLNRAFYTFHERHRPHYILKWAQSLNGKMGKTVYETNESKSVSGPLSWRLSHKWRAECQAIVVGVQTIITDNPLLNPRLYPGNAPKIIVLDPKLRTPKDSKIFSTEGRVVIFNSLKDETGENIAYRKISFDDDWHAAMNQILFEMNIQSVLVEGGPYTLNKFIQSGNWDEARIFQSETFLNWDMDAPKIPGMLLGKERIGNDTLLHTYNNHWHSW